MNVAVSGFILAIVTTAVTMPTAKADQRAKANEKAEVPPKKTFKVDGHAAFVIMPKQLDEKSPVPWVWYAPTLPGLPGPEERWMFERFSRAGIAVAGIDVGESYGSPDGRALLVADTDHTTVQSHDLSALLRKPKAQE